MIDPDEEAVLIRELDALFREPEFAYVHETLERIEEIFVDVIEAGIARGELRPDVDAHFLYRMMMDVMVLAMRCDQTRVITYMLGNAGSNKVHKFLGLSEGHHCLLYTSDAADEDYSVDLGGRRIIKKK